MIVYSSGHVHSQTVSEAFAAGGPFKIRTARCELQPGPMFVYGNLRGLGPLLQQAQRNRQDWYYADRGYFDASRGSDYSGFFRVTKNAYMHDGIGAAKADRWLKLGKVFAPWKKDGRRIVVCPPGAVHGQLRGFDSDEWLSSTLATLRENTDRPIFVRKKPDAEFTGIAFDEEMKDCFALVCRSSNAAVDALLLGVPVFTTHDCAASILGGCLLENIETPVYPDRNQWAWNLAAAQWTLEEMRNGTCRKELGL
jgi:hypothetical protein